MIFLLGFPPVLMSSASTRLVRTASSSSRRYWLVPGLSTTLGSTVSSLLIHHIPTRSALDKTAKAPCFSVADLGPQSLGKKSRDCGPFLGESQGPTVCSCVSAPALCSFPRAAGLWVQVVPSLTSLFLNSLQCSNGHTVLDGPKRTVDELSGCHGAIWLCLSRVAFCCSLLASAAVTPCCVQELFCLTAVGSVVQGSQRSS